MTQMMTYFGDILYLGISQNTPIKENERMRIRKKKRELIKKIKILLRKV